MNKKYFYVWFMFAVTSFADVFAYSYWGGHETLAAFGDKKYSDEQRADMLKLLDQYGLLAQAAMRGTITALEHSNIDSLLRTTARILVNEVDSKNFPEKFGRELVSAVVRGDIPQEFANELVSAVKRSDLPEEFGKGFSAGLIKGVTENLKNSEVVADFTKSLNKSFKEMADGVTADLDKSVGKGSKLDKKVDELSDRYGSKFNSFYRSTVLKNMVLTGGVIVVITAAVYSIPFAIRTIERQMKRPKLIIESSQLTMMEKLSALFITPVKKKPMEAMVFSPTLKKYLDDIVAIVSKSHAKIKAGKTNVKYRNLMLYGPPGTGKTMFAKELARCSGLEFACMSGSSFSKFQEGEAIEALDELFAWAQKCNGLMIFIDEAETFLSKRENMDPQSKAYQLLNNFLNYTGQRSSNFMIVFATNHKDVLDSAMYRRIDDLIEMPLPSKKQRIDTLILYKNKILMDTVQNEKSLTSSVAHFLTHAVIEQMAQDTKGLSYGELEGIMNNIKTEADILDHPAVNADLIKTVVNRVVKKHQDFTNGKYLGSIED